MSKQLKIKQIAGSLILLAVIVLQACSSDETYDVTGSEENKVYINTQSWTPIDAPNGYYFAITRTPIGSTLNNGTKIEAGFTVQCTKPALNDIRVQFEYDGSVMPSPAYKAFPAGVRFALDKKELIIPQGAMISGDSITVSVENEYIGLFEEGKYALPIKIVSVTNASQSAQNSASIVVQCTFNNIVNGATSVSGTALNRAGWSAMFAGVNTGTSLLDNVNTTYVPGLLFPSDLEIDMQSVHENITGIRLHYQGRNYCISTANVYIREEADEDYKLQGPVSLARPGNTSPYPQHIAFIGKVKARYVKIEVITPYSSASGLRPSEVFVYQE